MSTYNENTFALNALQQGTNEYIDQVINNLKNQLKSEVVDIDCSAVLTVEQYMDAIKDVVSSDNVLLNIKIFWCKRNTLRRRFQRETANLNKNKIVVGNCDKYINMLFNLRYSVDLYRYKHLSTFVESPQFSIFLRECVEYNMSEVMYMRYLFAFMNHYNVFNIVKAQHQVVLKYLYMFTCEFLELGQYTIIEDMLRSMLQSIDLKLDIPTPMAMTKILSMCTYEQLKSFLHEKAIAQVNDENGFPIECNNLIDVPMIPETMQASVDRERPSFWSKMFTYRTTTGQLIDTANEMIQEVKERHAIPLLCETIEITNKIGKEMSQTFTAIATMISSTLTTISTTFKADYFSMFEDLVEIAYMLYCDYTVGFKNIPIIRWILYFFKVIRLFRLTQVITNSMDWCVKLVFEHLDIFGQGNFTQAGHATHEIIIAVVGLIMMRTIPNSTNIKSVTEIARLYNTVMPVITDGFSFFKESLAFLPECVNLWTRYLCPKLFWSDALKEGIVSTWAAEVALFLQEDPTLVQYDAVKVERLKKLYEQGRIYETQVGLSPDIPQSFSHLIHKQMRALEPYHNMINDMSKWGSTRKTPFCICLHGASQLGKSSLASMIAMFLFPDLPEGKARYCRKVADEFWSRYTGQPVVVYDDVFSSVELKDALELIDAISNAPYPLNMPCVNDPALGNKGAELKAQVVILNTNTPFPPTDGIIFEKDALYNRRHLMVEVKVKEGYMNLNGSVRKDWDYKYLYFQITDNKHDRIIYQKIDNLDDLMLFIGDQFEKWLLKEGEVLASIRRNAERASKLGAARKQRVLEQYGAPTCAKEVKDTSYIMDEVLIDIPARALTPKRKSLWPDWTRSKDAPVCQGFTERLKENWSHKAEGEALAKPYIWPSIAIGIGALEMLKGWSEYKKSDSIRFDSNSEQESYERWTKIRMLVGAFAGVLGIFRMFALFKSADPIPVDKAIVCETRYGDRTVKQKRTRVVAHSTTDQNASDLVFDSIMPRLAEIQVAGKSIRTMGCLPIGGRLLLAPYHLFLDCDGDLIAEGARMSLTIEGHPTFINYFQAKSMKRLQHIDGTFKDCVVYNFGRSMRAFKSLLHHFISEKDLSNLKRFTDAYLVKYSKQTEIIKVSQRLEKFNYFTPDGNSELTFSRGWQYQALTKAGDCGSPIIMFDVKCPRKLLGIHVCGRSETHVGYSEMITCELMAQFNDIIRNDVENFPIPPNLSDADSDITIPGSLAWLGTCTDKAVTQSLVLKTDIRKSPIFGEMRQAVTAPSVLSPFDRRIVGDNNPWQNGINNLQPALPFEHAEMALVLDHMKLILRSWQKQPIGVCTEFDAINGNKKISPYFEAMNLHSSPGIPYSRMRKVGEAGGKFFLMKGQVGSYEVGHVKLRERLDERENQAKVGQRIESIVAGCLKDERRKLEKIPVAATRFFCLFPADHTILMRRYFQEFVCAVFEHYKDSFSAIGINPYSGDWDDMINSLKAFSDVGFSGDYKHYDGTMNAELMFNVLDLVEYFYRDEEDHQNRMLIRTVLFDEIVHTIMLVGNTVFAKHGSDPSGTTLTTVINTFVNYMILAYSFLKMAPPLYKSMKCFVENVRPKMFGDDNIVAVNPRVLFFYNLEYIVQFLRPYGIELKDSKKTGNILPFQKIEELDFLKNGIRRNGCFWFATLAEDSIYEMLNWIRDSPDPRAALLDNCNTALRHMYFYGPNDFRTFRNKLDNILFKHYEGDYQLYTYAYLDAVFLDNKCSFERLEEIEMETCFAQGGDEPTTSDVSGQKEVVGITSDRNDIHFSELSGVGLNENSDAPPVRGPLDSIMSEPSWDFNKILGKPMRLGTYQWTTTQTVGTVIKQVYPFFASLTKNSIYGAILQSFMFFKANVVIRAEVNGYRFTQGRLIMYGVPMLDDAIVTNWHRFSRCASSSVRHCFIDACENSVVELKLPFIYNKSHYQTKWEPLDSNPTTPTNTIEPWNVHLDVFNQLKVNVTTGGSTTVNISLFMHFEDVQLKVPAPAFIAQASVDIKMKGWDRLVSSFMPQNIIRDALDSYRGRDKPNDPVNPNVMVRKAFGYQSNSRNIEHLHKMCYEPSIQVDPAVGLFGVNEDEMSIDYLKKRFTFLTMLNVTTSTSAAKVLWECPISPIPNEAVSDSSTWPSAGCGLNLADLSATSNPIGVPLLTYISMPFSYWYGSIKFRFDMVATSFHTAKFAFVIHYGTAYNISMEQILTAGSSAIDPTSSYTTFFELNSEKKCFEFEVPYISLVPYKRIPNSMWQQHGGIDIDLLKVMQAFETNIGHCALMLINPLVAPATVAPNVDINVFMCGGDDFTLANVANNNTGFTAFRGGVNGFVPATAEGDCNIISPDHTPATVPRGLDVVHTFKDCLKRYSLFNWQPQAGTILRDLNRYVGSPFPPVMSYTLPINYVVNGLTATSLTNNSMFAHVASMYRGWLGSMRFKFLQTYQSRQVVNPFPPAGTGVPLVDQYNYPIGAVRFSVAYVPEYAGRTASFQPPYESVQNATGNFPVFGTDTLLTGSQFNPSSQQGDIDKLAVPTTSFSPYTSIATRIPITWRGPIDVMNWTCPYHEIEIPWMQPYLFSLTSLDLALEKLNVNGSDLSFYSIFHSFAANGGNLLVNFEDSVNQVNVMAAAGDDFHFGIFMGTPLVGDAQSRGFGLLAPPIDFFPNLWATGNGS